RATAGQKRVAQNPHQVVEVLVPVQHARPGEHSRKRLLDEVLGVLARAAQPPGGAIETVDVLGQRLWIQGAHMSFWRRSRPGRVTPHIATVAPAPQSGAAKAGRRAALRPAWGPEPASPRALARRGMVAHRSRA